MSDSVEVGLISDTHGLLRPEAVAALEGVDQIVHAGDVGPQSILDTLEQIAPVSVVRGNTDHGTHADVWPATAAVQVAGRVLYVVHDILDLDIDPGVAEMAAVVYGHSHQPSAEVREGVLFVNPGSAGPRRFTLPITVARLRLRGQDMSLDFCDLETAATERWDG
ncbi:MAG: YfcE family phosphodiesterase [Acidobacteria bacterium]|nr:YfcE family phosphodiesterase [Acidobacteriota bacterium]